MVIELLKELISIESSNKDGANTAVDFCAGWLTRHGLSPKLLENNGYKMLICEIGSGDKTIIFNGHVDVVSGQVGQFMPFEKEGKLYGRGSADMKAGVAAMMCALYQLSEKHLDIKIQLQIVSDEEIGGFNCSGYLVEQGYVGDFVICSEPTQLDVALQAKGVLQLDIKEYGVSAHGSRPWQGENAIEKAYNTYQKIRTLPFTTESSEYYSFPSLNLAKIHAGDVYNKVPDECTVSLDIRYLPTQRMEDILKQIKGVTDGSVLVNMFAPPIETSKDHSVLTQLSPILKKLTNRDPVFFGQHGTADTVFFSKKGIPAIEFGPSGANWHGDEEYVWIDSVYIYENILIELASSLK
ncbi:MULTISPECIES: M20 family metallopeptidase [unclassified Bacillus (in: firmicutes)]|uniref:M20 family metallopeptidase n=1 Tax=unclassified Bacillus (in: firmicutes) TaxID=185979 RepID=UPI0008EA6225|nr:MULTISPECIES: M20/M25/M40 family metallo-hydrolase [unclassified Bacillus (in: firmicutes)]SFB09887.1 succinyl-diaminopimelate desuccinylase [Bacillus sp. UNCCL13]SFQ86505.1 succinyl-diaminopimelate desuccinylase [Bacillus sp. cl95]